MNALPFLCDCLKIITSGGRGMGVGSVSFETGVLWIFFVQESDHGESGV